MSPNDVGLVRVYTKVLGGKISDTTLPVSSGFKVIVEAEAGTVIYRSGAQFLTNILVRDLSANDTIPATLLTQAASGAMSSSALSGLYRTFQYKVNKAHLAGRENHMCQVISFVHFSQQKITRGEAMWEETCDYCETQGARTCSIVYPSR